MEDKKQGTHVSSGASKVENIEEATRSKKPQAKSSANRSVTKKSTQKKKTGSAKKPSAESKQAQTRIALAKARAERKEKKLLARAELKQKKLDKRAKLNEKRLERKARAEERRAQLKAKKVERRAEKIARRETLKHESAEQKKRRIEREKKQRIALRRQRQEAKERALAEKRKNRAERKKHRDSERSEKRSHRREKRSGIGGWLAAVISLGVACLALATVVTAGAFRMNDMNLAAGNSFRTTLYEMVSVTEDMDDNLSKLRISEGASEQRTLLTNLLVDTALLESTIERIPLDEACASELSMFANNTNAFVKGMLKKLSAGGKLTNKERKALNGIYEINRALHGELNELSMGMKECDMYAFMAGMGDDVMGKFNRMREGMHQGVEELIDAPFSQHGNVAENMLAKQEEIDAARAEELVKSYLGGYRVRDIEYAGETHARDMVCYNFNLTDESDVGIYAQISKQGGKLVFFERYEPCAQKNFDLATCDTLAKEFLAELGITDVEAVWFSESGTSADLTYVSVQKGVRMYPDTVRIRVCEEKGVVVAMDCSGYLLNHTERSFTPALTKKQQRAKLSAAVEVEGGALALAPVDGREVLCYEFTCSYEGEQYIVYLDANTGDEVQVFCVKNSAQGRYLR